MSKIGAVILGAGFGRRFGSDKRMHLLPSGQTVASTTVQLYCQQFEYVRAVIRPEDTLLEENLKAYPIELVHAADAHLGMGHSLAVGFDNLPLDWAFVGLMDMPYIQPTSLTTLISAATEASHGCIIQPKYMHNNNPCHPIIWHSSYFSEIQASEGDQGARTLLKKYQPRIKTVILEDPGICQDIDQPQDIRK